MQSMKIEGTLLWQVYKNKESNNRYEWVKDVYCMAVEYLKAVRDTFPNYTLHDETHVLNVINAMSGILGDKIDLLSVGELELLILAASLHDIGMVYSKEDKHSAIQNKKWTKIFLLQNYPELLGRPCEEWPEEAQQYYLRSLHPFRLPEILNHAEWRELFGRRPKEIVPNQCIIAVCQAHGEMADELKNNPSLKFLVARDTDPLFCALLLRLADLLDFDDTRAPKVLFSYTANNADSVTEWKKHMDSIGFTYPGSPSTCDLPYVAECTNPGVEHTIRKFLDWVDDELLTCRTLKVLCGKEWQHSFPFPRAVSRNEIISTGYVRGDFKLTMNQSQILALFSGEHLYGDNTIFIRELLQNAIDATLLREKMDQNFDAKNSHIDLWEWPSNDGYIWFRIDDHGTGMTLGMLERYFLKVGNSYYTSKELIRDLRLHGYQGGYYGISHFGIGFLSCFLCGNFAEISTLYFDERKNQHEGYKNERLRFGLRLKITGLDGYYTIKSEAENHQGGLPLPAHPSVIEYREYRNEPGTSIVIRLDPRKLGAINLKEITKKFICGTRMPIYFNGERIGHTYLEILDKVHRQPYEVIYELPPEDKKRFDDTFPEARGQYPKIVTKVVSIDAKRYPIMSNALGVIVDHEVYFDTCPQWKVKDQTYELLVYINERYGKLLVNIWTSNMKKGHDRGWKELEHSYDIEELAALKRKLMVLETCPTEPESLGDVWKPFAEKESLPGVWASFVDNTQKKELDVLLEKNFPMSLNILTDNAVCSGLCYSYNGILIEDLGAMDEKPRHCTNALFFCENGWQPIVNIARSRVLDMPLELCMIIYGILYHPDVGFHLRGIRVKEVENILLPQWRQIRRSEIGHWLWNTQKENVAKIQQQLHSLPEVNQIRESHNDLSFLIRGDQPLFRYLMAYFQDTYEMTIDFETRQTIIFNEKSDLKSDKAYDLFPPMMFCKAANEQSRCYLCCADKYLRRGINSDHPFASWLLQNAEKLTERFVHQIQQILVSLCAFEVNKIIQITNDFREQLISLYGYYNIDFPIFDPLTEDDFWYMDI